MVDVVPHCRQQVHEPLGDAVELLREPRHRVAQLTDTVALEARVIGDDAARPGARLDQRFSERGPRILGAVGDPLVMHQPAAPLLDVDAELHRYELPRPASRPAWDGETHRLEVQKGERRRELGECRRERGLHHHATGLDRLHLARVDHRQLEIGGQVVERGIPVRLILEHLLPLDAVQAADVVVGKRWPTAFDERALMRFAAMIPDRDIGKRAREHAGLGGQLVGHADQHALDHGRHVLAHEQVGEVGIATLGVQVHHLDAFHREPRAPQHVHLDGRIGEVFGLLAVGGLHLDHTVAARRALQDVHADVGVVGEEPGLVERRQLALERRARRRHLVVVLIEREVDERTPRDILPRSLSHLLPLGESVLLSFVGRQLRSVGLVHPPPQLLVALQAVQIARLGESGAVRGNASTVMHDSPHDARGALVRSGRRHLTPALGGRSPTATRRSMPPAVLIALAILLLTALVAVVLLRRSGGERASGLIQQQLIELRARFDQLVAAQQEVPRTLAAGSTEQARVLHDVRERLGALGEVTKRLETMAETVTEVQQLLQVPRLRGTIGEVWLEELLRQILPPTHYEMQYQYRSGERERRAFTKSLRDRIDEIADKYIRPDEGTYDFALMYIPAENVYYEAVLGAEDPGDQKSVLGHAMQRRVIPVSPHTFYAYLLVILHGLKGMQVEEQAREIQGQLGGLRQQFEGFWAAFQTVGTHLTNAYKKFEESERQADRVRDRLERIAGPGGTDGAQQGPGALAPPDA